MSKLYANPVLCIAGPTASGKSAVAISLAKMLGGEVINADALQVYSDLGVISARPDAAEMDGVPHHMFGHIDGRVRYSVGAWRDEVVPIILDIMARGRVPIITGGTGLYFRALTDGLADIPAIASTIRAGVQDDLNVKGIKALREEAERVDPAASARVLGDDPARLSRIVEVARSTGRPLSDWQEATRPIIPRPYWDGVKLLPNRATLYERINQRFDTMSDDRGFNEVRALMARNLNPDLPVMKAIGVPQLAGILSGDVSHEEGIEAAKRETRRFAKRQFTWFRGQAKDWAVCEGSNAILRKWEKISKIKV